MALTIIAKNMTLGALPMINLSVANSAIPASGQATLTDTNSVSDIQSDPQILGYVTSGDVVLNDGVNDLSTAAGMNFLSGVAISTPPASIGDVLVWNGGSWEAAAGGAPALSAVLSIGNTSGANDILLAPAQRLDTDVAGTLKLGLVNATGFELGNTTTPNPAPLPGGDPMVLINQGGAQIGGSNAGIQYSTIRANRAQFRGNQFGGTAAGPGITGYKSRGAAIGDGVGVGKVGVIDGDLLFRITAIGVARNDSSIPLAALLSLQVPPGGSLPLSNYVASELELQLVPLEGPTNGATVMFKITSQGVPVLRETDLPPVAPPVPNRRVAGLATLDGAGQLLILNPNVKAGTRFTLTVQDGGTLATGNVQVVARVVGTSFTIASSVVTDAGAIVYWQLWEGV